MSLAEYQPERRVFDLKTGPVTVQGLSLESISILVREHMPDLEALADLLGKGENLQGADVMTLATAIVSQAPGFAANVIALAANEPDAAPQAQKMPGPLQVDLLVAIGELTFLEVGGVKKSWETIAGLLMTKEGKTLTKALKQTKTRPK